MLCYITLSSEPNNSKIP